MSPQTDLETRLTDALAARAEQVRPEDLSSATLTVPPVRRGTPLVLMLAAAACVLLAVILAAELTGDDGRLAPAPQPDGPRIVIPPDIGRDWAPAPESTPAELDLDGDGTSERVRFLGEPTKRYDGRVRLQTRLSGSGETAYGLVDVGTSIGLAPLDPIDADSDGDEELVLYHDSAESMQVVVMVLDLHDGVLVEAPATDPGLLRRGPHVVPGASGPHYDMVRLVDFWIEDGTLFSVRSVNAFASAGMSIYRPEEYVMDAFEWRLRDDGMLTPEPAPTPCLVAVPEGQRACQAGETDSLPAVAPVADERIGIGETFTSRVGYRFEVALEAPTGGSDATLVVDGEDGRHLEVPLRIGAEPGVFTVQPTAVFYDGASVLVASGNEGASAMQILIQDGERMLVAHTVGDVPLGTGRTEDARPVRTWLTRNGEIFTAVADSDDELGPWELYSWTATSMREVVAVPRGSVCFADPAHPATVERC